MQKKQRARHKTYVPTYITQPSRFRLLKPFNPEP